MDKSLKQVMSENTAREKAIASENQDIYTNMIAYIRGANLSDRDVESIRMDLTDMLIEAQDRGDNIQQVFGNNYKEICDEIIDAMPKKTMKDHMLDAVDIFLSSAWILGIIAMINHLARDFGTHKQLTHFTLTNGRLISMLAIIFLAYGVVMYVTKTALNAKESKKKHVLEVLVMVVMMTLIFLPTLFMNKVILETSYLTAIIVILILFLLSKFVGSKV